MADVARALGLEPVAPDLAGLAVKGFSIDSRTIASGELFFAIRGPRFDGHDFVGAALAAGACGAVVCRNRIGEYPESLRLRLWVWRIRSSHWGGLHGRCAGPGDSSRAGGWWPLPDLRARPPPKKCWRRCSGP